MAKSVVRISLATKFRLLFGTAALGIIAAALVVPWYFTERMPERQIQTAAEELTRLRLNEWQGLHAANPLAARNESSAVVALYSQQAAAQDKEDPLFLRTLKDREGPLFVRTLTEADRKSLSRPAQAALGALRKGREDLAIIPTEGPQGQTVYRCFRAVRVQSACSTCHPKDRPELQLPGTGEPAGLIELALPGSAAARPLISRLSFVFGGVLGALVALVFWIITQRLVIRPVRHLRQLVDKVAEGDLSVRSSLRSNDELQRLGDRFNQMLSAIADQHEKLVAANKALDLKLSELAEANVSLFQANKIKSEFLANVSHELRTPLNSIIGFADLLAESPEERIRRYGANISAAAKNLLNMINDLLDLARIEAGKAQVRFDRVSVTDTCQTLVALMKPLADKKQLDLQADLAEDVPIVVTDGSKLQQILYNLLSNAIKFTPVGGKVTVSASKGQSARAGQTVDEVCVSVADTGPGIAEADQQQIFEKFYQADKTLTKESGGTGLGLAISRELTNLLGGRLTLKSSAGHGAVFSLHLPVEPKPNGPAPQRKS